MKVKLNLSCKKVVYILLASSTARQLDSWPATAHQAHGDVAVQHCAVQHIAVQHCGIKHS